MIIERPRFTDVLGRWIDENCRKEHGARTDVDELYRAWSRFAEANGIKLTNHTRKFRREIGQRFGPARPDAHNVLYYNDLALVFGAMR